MNLVLATGCIHRTFRPMSMVRRSSRQRAAGFTLIELMITVAIVALLAAIAFPSYQSHVRKGYRAAAQSFLMDVAQKQTQFLIDNRAYASTTAALSVTTPTDVNNLYTISIAVTAGPPPTFTVTATPKAGTVQASDSVLTINQAGQKTPTDKW